MQLSDPTHSLLQELETLSGHRLLRRDDLGLLIDCAQRTDLGEVLADLAFQSKFAHKTRGIMQRIGPGAEGYDGLAREFAAAVEQVRTHLGTLLAHAPATDATRARYLAMTPVALEELLALMNDLSWYKNWLIDRP